LTPSFKGGRGGSWGIQRILNSKLNMLDYAILINSCDHYDDCWEPFFKLWKTYWPDCRGKLYLLTEYKDYSYPGLDVTPLKVCERNSFPRDRRATWSKCVRWALEAIPQEVVFYVQEDYFLTEPVRNDELERLLALMEEHPEIKCLHVTDWNARHFHPSRYGEKLWEMDRFQNWRVSCQAAFWRKDELLAILRDREDAWNFEYMATRRSAAYGHTYLSVAHDWAKHGTFDLFNYVRTGIEHARWKEEVVPLFEKHGIRVDFSRRGMLADWQKPPFHKRLPRKFKVIGKYVVNLFDILAILLHGK